jgi:predicted glutamine amidotransferase
MCELLGLSAQYPVTLEMSFQKLMQRAELSNPHGWGAVFYEQNDAYVFREPRPASNSKLANLLAECGIESHLVISHIRKATSGAIELRNTHPFTREIDGRLHSFAFNGDVPGVFDLGLELTRFFPMGVTDGEYAFCWILEQLTSQVDAIDWKRSASILKSFGQQLAAMGPANFLYSDSQYLYAFASRRTHSDGIHPPGLHYIIRQCDQQQHAIPCVGLNVKSTVNTTQKLVLIASVPLSEEAWLPFEENQLLVIEKGLILNHD